jgi:LytR cell envelope-related transcriptional attenuator
MSDVSEGSGPIPRRVPRASDGGAPASGALAIVLAVVAVVAGFFILRSISDDGDRQLDIQSPAASGGSVAPTDSAPGTTAAPLPIATTEPPLVTAGATVVVANANGIKGTAGSMSTALQIAGFTMGEPSNKSDGIDDLDITQIWYDPAQPAAQQVAESVNRALGGGLAVTPLAGPPPVQSGTINGAGVLVMLGKDKANKTLEELNPTGSSSPVVVTNPQLTGTTAPAG